MTSLAALIDLERYPLDRLDSPAGEALVDRCRTMLAQSGACQLHDFVRPEIVTELIAEAQALRPAAHHTDDTHNVYFEPTERWAALPESDVRRHLEHSSKFTAGYDRIAAQSPLRRLFETDELTGFVRRCLGLPELYRDADPAAALSYAIFARGDELGWHFDRSEFAVTIMLAPSPDGGTYEYAQDVRTPTAENYDQVAAILAGTSDSVITLHNRPGTLSLFRGRYSIHRVTPNASDTPRVNAVLAYATTRDHVMNEVTRELFYGTPAVAPAVS